MCCCQRGTLTLHLYQAMRIDNGHLNGRRRGVDWSGYAHSTFAGEFSHAEERVGVCHVWSLTCQFAKYGEWGEFNASKCWDERWGGLIDWLEFNGTFSTVRLYSAFRSYSLRFLWGGERFASLARGSVAGPCSLTFICLCPPLFYDLTTILATCGHFCHVLIVPGLASKRPKSWKWRTRQQ